MLCGIPKQAAGRILVLMAFAVIGYSIAWKTAPLSFSDSFGYLEVAHDLADFRLEKIHFRPPGYPFVLRLLNLVDHQATKRLVVFGLCLHMLSLWMLAVVLHHLGLSQRQLVLFVFLLSLPPFVQPAAYILSENLAQFLLAGALTALLLWIRQRQQRYLFLCGTALAAATLTKPTYQLQAPALMASLVVCTLVYSAAEIRPRQALWTGGAVVALAILPLLGLAFFNYVHFDRFSITPGNIGHSLSTKTVKVLERLPDEVAEVRETMIAVRNRNLIERGSSHTAEQYYPEARAAVAEVTGVEGPELDALLLRLNLELIAKAPLHYALHTGQSVVSYWFPTIARFNFGGSKLSFFFWAAFHFIFVVGFIVQLTVLGGLFTFEFSRRWSWRRFNAISDDALKITFFQFTAYVLALSMVVYTMAVSCLIHHGEPRFRTVTDPLIVFVCFLGVSIWRRLLASQRRPGG